MHLPVGKFVLGTSLFLSLASAKGPQQQPAHYCLCTEPHDGNQDSPTTKEVCKQFASNGGRSVDVIFDGPGGGSFQACAGLDFSYKARFGNACLKVYGDAGNDGLAGAQCCTPDKCEDYHGAHDG
ncbi:hypothetical protein AC578_9654 [Pseudocercospora eumusae]|uniref:Uncharacterized protein n=1 Tax=Pseudocercospora eumusae TaxID=321146 RepID=A0A139GVS4_9PEZI|nr:hypothetical protein AC578_9654 [Pseudocercospora eumusae]